MADNLMIDSAILDSSKTLIISSFNRTLDDLTLFEHAVSRAKKYLNGEDLKEFDFYELW